MIVAADGRGSVVGLNAFPGFRLCESCIHSLVVRPQLNLGVSSHGHFHQTTVIHFRSYIWTVLVAFAVPITSALGQQVETPAGPVEFVGLHRWTVQMIQDSMKVHAPGQPLGHCAAVLRSMGFPSPQALYMTSPDRPPSILVLLVEPQDSDLVHYRPWPTHSHG